MCSILITGGTGFIGSHTSLLLLQKGHKVYILDSNINSSEKVIKNILNALKVEGIDARENLFFFKGDICNENNIKKVFLNAKDNGEEITSVIHFAGLKAVAESIKYPIKYWENNLKGTINLLKIMSEFNCRNIIFSSSATIYIPESEKPIKESSKIGPINPYGNTKSTIEVMLNDLFKSSPQNWKIANLRYFNPIGAHFSGLIGENPLGKPNNIFPLINLVALGKIEKLYIFGNKWNTHDGTCIRDYIHVMDVAEGHISTLNFLWSNDPQIININLGTGKGHSVLELVKTFERVNNVVIPYEFTIPRKGDNPFVVADNKMASLILKWRPKRTLEEMCKDGWNSNNFKKDNKKII